MRKALAILALLAAGLWAAPVLAASSPTLDLAAWVRTNTDLAVSQVAIAGPDNVYSLEPVGPRLPTGEVLALVRTEAMSEAWRAAHQFQSWDAHMLFDCQGGRVRVLRSTSYLERDRQGGAKEDERGDAWSSPQPRTPAATLLGAACDVGFSWPLRAQPAVTPPAPVEPPPVQMTVASLTRPVAPPPVRPVVLAASPDMPQFASPASAQLVTASLQKTSFTAQATLPPLAVKPSRVAAETRPSGAFATVASATRSCKRLASAGGGWLWRHVEVAFRRDETPARLRTDPIRQTQLS